MKPISLPARLIAATVLVTLAKLAAVVYLVHGVGQYEDAFLATEFARTGTIGHTHYATFTHTLQFPCYTFLVGGLYWLVGFHLKAALALNLVLNALNACVLIYLFMRLFDRLQLSDRLRPYKGVVVATSVVAFLVHPLISYYVMHNVHPFVLDMLMLYLPLLLLFRFFDRGETIGGLILFALALGLAILNRPVLVVSLMPMIALTWQRSGFRRAAQRTALVATIAFLVGVPWLIRNYRLDGIIGYTSTTGELLWKGVLADSEGSNYLTNGQPYASALTPEEERFIETRTISETNRFFWNKYLDVVRTRPLQVLRLFGLKLRNFFWFRSQIGSAYGPEIRRFVPIYEIGYGLVFLMALSSIVFARAAVPLVWSVVAGLALLQSVFYVETRHRLVIEPLLIFLATLTAVHLWVWLRQRSPSGKSGYDGPS